MNAPSYRRAGSLVGPLPRMRPAPNGAPRRRRAVRTTYLRGGTASAFTRVGNRRALQGDDRCRRVALIATRSGPLASVQPQRIAAACQDPADGAGDLLGRSDEADRAIMVDRILLHAARLPPGVEYDGQAPGGMDGRQPANARPS